VGDKQPEAGQTITPNMKIRPWAFSLLVVLMIVPYKAMADDFKLTPAIGIKQEYSDNILYSPTEVKSDFLSTISPELVLTDKTERCELMASGRIDQRFYLHNSQINGTDQFYEGTGKYALTQRLNLNGRVYYSQDGRPGLDLLTTGLPLTNVTRERQNYTVGWDYRPSERNTFTFSYDYLSDQFNSLYYSDMEAHTFDLAASRDLGFIRPTKVMIDMNYAKYNIPALKIDNYEATLGFQRAFTEKWSLSANGGARYTDSVTQATEQIVQPFPPIPFFQVIPIASTETTGWGWIGALSLNYQGEHNDSNGSLSVIHNILPASGYSGATERTSFVLGINKRFTYELYGTFSASYYINKSSPGQFSTLKIDENSTSVSPGIRYEFNREKFLEVSYSYSITNYYEYSTWADRNAFMVRFRIQHDLIK